MVEDSFNVGRYEERHSGEKWVRNITTEEEVTTTAGLSPLLFNELTTSRRCRW